MSEFVCPKCGTSLSVSTVDKQAKRALSIQDVRVLFPSDLEELLTFQQKDDIIIVRPKRFLGSENFAKIAHIVRANRGE